MATYLTAKILVLLFSLSSVIGLAGRDFTKANVCTTAQCTVASANLLIAMDTSVDPCDNFYQYACGNYPQTEELSALSPSSSPLHKASSFASKRLRELIERRLSQISTANHTFSGSELSAETKFLRFYNACNDVEAINRGFRPKAQQIASEMGGFLWTTNDTNPKSWLIENSLLLIQNRFNAPILFDIGMTTLQRSGEAILLIAPPISLSDTIETKNLLSDDFRVLGILMSVLSPNRVPNPKIISDILTFGKLIRKIFTDAQLRQDSQQDTVERYLPVNSTFLQQYYGFINWTRYLEGITNGSNVDFAVIERDFLWLSSDKFFDDLTKLVNSYMATVSGRRTMQNYLILSTLQQLAMWTGGNSKKVWQRDAMQYYCLSTTMSFQADLAGVLFVKNFVNESDIQVGMKFVEQIISSLRSRIEKTTWMDNKTKASALEKIDSMVALVGYDELLLNETDLNNYYSPLVITDDHVQNMFNIIKFVTEKSLKHIGKVSNSSSPVMPPQMANAYNDPRSNTIFIPAALISEPFFYSPSTAPAALSFGVLGYIIGHEATHGFDSYGRHFDKEGEQCNWWSEQSSEEFTERVQCFIEKYDSYYVKSLGGRVDGNKTLIENIADNGGIKVAYDAFKSWKNYTESSEKLVGFEHFSDDQLFFLAYGNAFCTYNLPQLNSIILNVDNHAPGEARVVLSLANFPAFASAFSCPVGSKMNPVEKCSIW